jgi:F420-dependent oxidoreductase-like protein
MRFGVFIPQGWRHDLVDIEPEQQWATMRRLALAADAGPWESLWVYDHFHTVPAPTQEATHEAWTLMSAFAAVTDRIRLGQMCTCMSYRNPVALAKIAATVDHVSGGRVEMGIGAGWYEHEWRAYGYGFPGIGERLARLREGVEIFRQAWTTGTATLDGEHYQVDGAIVRPLPLQPGGIPMWIAGGGEKVTLRIAAEYASATNFGVGDLDEFARKNAIVDAHCTAIGRDAASITRSANANVIIADTPAEAAARIDAIEARQARFVGPEVAAGAAMEYRNGTAFVGSVQEITDRIAAAAEVGLDYLITYFPDAAYDRGDQERFEREVIPALG